MRTIGQRITVGAALAALILVGGAVPAHGAPAAPSGDRDVVAVVHGRRLEGVCTGSSGKQPPVILESGMAGGRHELDPIADRLATDRTVCSYDRAGVGSSTPTDRSPRTLDDVVTDLRAFVRATGVRGPVVLVGQSVGGDVVQRYAQRFPDRVVGFVSMNPVPPRSAFLRGVRRVETDAEFADELAFYGGGNEEAIALAQTDRLLQGCLPGRMRFRVLYGETADGDPFLERVLPVVSSTTALLAGAGRGGRSVTVDDAGHEIFSTRPDAVLHAIDEVSVPGR